MPHGKFEFKGSGGGFFWLMIWTCILTVLTLGIFFPWAVASIQSWIQKNTYIDGKRLCFKGSGAGFFGNWLLIVILSFITIGIYIPWGVCRLQRWITNNTYYADTGDIEHE
jgi:uncharacterized membrane protein YjgN (DUF898 family)